MKEPPAWRRGAHQRQTCIQCVGPHGGTPEPLDYYDDHGTDGPSVRGRSVYGCSPTQWHQRSLWACSNALAWPWPPPHRNIMDTLYSRTGLHWSGRYVGLVSLARAR